jgi:hypothetical protein
VLQLLANLLQPSEKGITLLKVHGINMADKQQELLQCSPPWAFP